MLPLYGVNGLVTWDESEIACRDYLIGYFAKSIETILRSINRAWLFYRIEAPTLTPPELINKNYTLDDVWATDNLVLRPETTMGSYVYAKKLLAEKGSLMPFCVWQAGKSYRKEQDKTLTNMRLKEFWQQEFQCFYSDTTKADYQDLVMEELAAMFTYAFGLPLMFTYAFGLPIRIIDSERLPDYSIKTIDLEAPLAKGWMEICSVSLRKDFAENIKVLEIAIGLDRCVRLKTYNEEGP